MAGLALEPEAPIVDTHAHVFTAEMPVAQDAWRKAFRPAPVEDFLRALDEQHIPFGVIAAASMFGEYSEYTLSTLRAHQRLRATVIVSPTVHRYTLRAMKKDGVVGVRWVWFMQPDLPDLRSAAYQAFLGRLAELDMHIEILLDGERLARVLDALADSPVKVVVDHFGFPDPAVGVACPGFQATVRALQNGRTWVKLAAWHRLGSVGTALTQRLLAEAGTDRLVWGSDWPFVAAHEGYRYEDALQSFYAAVPDHATRRRISETALRLYFST